MDPMNPANSGSPLGTPNGTQNQASAPTPPESGRPFRRWLIVGAAVLFVATGVYASVKLVTSKPVTEATPTPSVQPGISTTQRSAIGDVTSLGPTLLQVTKVIADQGTVTALQSQTLQVTGNTTVGGNLTTAGSGNFGGTVTAASFVGNGAGLSNVNASNLQGTVPDAHLSANVTLRNAPNTFSSTDTFTGSVKVSGPITISGPASLSGTTTISSLILSAPLSVSSGGTGLATIPVNGVVFGQGASSVGTAVPSSAGQCLVSTSTSVQFGSCAGSSGGVADLDGLTGSLTLANSTGSGSTVTINDATTLAKGIAEFNATNFSVTAGVVNTVQNLAVGSSPSFAGLTLTAPLAVASGGTGAASLTSNGVVIGQGTGALVTVTSSSAGQCLISNAGAPSFQSCPGGGGVISVNSQTGAINVANATGSGNVITINDATTASKGIASFNSADLTVTSGVVDTIQSIAVGSTPTFAGLSLTSALSLGNGGTGSTTAAGARSNLNAAAKGINSDITSLTGLTTALSFTQGGTGVTGTPANGQVLIGNGSGYSLNTLSAGSGVTITNAAGTITIAAPSSGSCAACANQALSNLASVALNTSLLPVAAGSADLGSGTLPFGQLSLAGTSSAPATNNFLVTGASTGGTRTITLPDASGTVAVSASGNIALNPTTGALSFTGLLPVANGGTNAGTAAGARTNLGAAGSGTNSDITSLTGLTTALSIGQGGTGSTTSGGARTALGAAASGANTDITSLSNLSTALSVGQGGTGVTTATNGQILIGTGSGLSLNTLTAGSGVIITNASGSVTISAPGSGSCSGCANTNLTNLGTVALNTSLLPGTAGAENLGSSSLPFGQLALSGSSSTPATNNFLFTGASTGGTRTLTLPDASGTIAVSASGPLSLDADGNLTCNTCLTSGGGGGAAGVSSLNLLTGDLVLQGVSAGSVTTAGSTVTISDASYATKGLSEFDSGNFKVTSGSVDTIQDIAVGSTPTFAGLNLTAALTVANGGTGSATAAGARTNLGAAASGGNTDITSLSGLTTALSTAQGGTGVVSTPGNGQILIGNATGFSLNTLTQGSGITITNNAGSITIAAPSSGSCAACANQALSNLSGVAINTSLLPGTAGSPNLGSAALPFGQLSLAGTSATPATNNFLITGTSTGGTRTITLPNASGTVAVSASGYLSLNTTTGNLIFVGPLAVADGGTGSASASGARTNLGAAASGTNTDITSLGGLTTALTVAQGGTGLASLTSNGVLIGNGTGNVGVVTGSSNGQCLVIVSGAPTFTTCTGAGGVSSVNSQTGAITVQGTTNQVSVGNVGGVFTLSTPQDINTTSSVAFSAVNTSTLQTGSTTRIDSSGNLSNIGTIGTSGLVTAGNGFTVTTGTITLSALTGGASTCLTLDSSHHVGATTCSTGSGTNPTLQNVYDNSVASPLITLSSTGKGLFVSDASSTVGGNLFAVQNNAGSTQYLAVTTAGISVAGAITTTGNITANGGSGTFIGDELKHTGLGGDSYIAFSGCCGTTIYDPNEIDLAGSPVVVSNLADYTLAPVANATYGVINIGYNFAGGNALTNGGTYIALNEPATGAGSAADFLNFETGATSKIKIDNAGDVISAGYINSVTGFKSNGTAGSSTSCSSGNVLQNPVVSGGIITSGTCVANGGGTSSVTLQSSSAGTPDTGNFNVSGIGIAGTALVSPKLRPVADSTTALQIQNAAGTVNVLTVDTTNSRLVVGSNGTASSQLYISGNLPTYLGQNSDSNLSSPNRMVNYSHYVFVMSNSHIQGYDISGGTPVYVGTNSDSNMNNPQNIAVSGHYVIVDNYGTGKLLSYDVSSGTPVYAGQNSDNASISDNWVVTSGHYAYTFATSVPNISVVTYDMSSGVPVYVTRTTDTNLTGATGAAISGHTLIVSDYAASKLVEYNLVNGIPTYTGKNSDSNLNNPDSVAISGHYAYVVDANGSPAQHIQVYNIASGTPVYVGQNSDTNIAISYHINISGNFAYVTTNGKVYVYDITGVTPVYDGQNADSNSSGSVATLTIGRSLYLLSAANSKLVYYDLGGSYIQAAQTGSLETTSLQVDNGSNINGDETVAGSLTAAGTVELQGPLGVGGNVIFQNSTNSGAAFQVQTSTGVDVLQANTSTGVVNVDGLTTPQWTSTVIGTSGGGLVNGQVYYYRITAVDAFGNESAPSSEILAFSNSGFNTMTPHWGVVTNAVGYHLYRGTTSGGEAGYINITNGSTTSFTDAGSALVGSSAPPAANTSGNVRLSSTGVAINPVSNSTSTLQVTNASAATILDVDTTNGRVGINTATPGSDLDVLSNATTTKAVNVTANSLTSGSALAVGQAGTQTGVTTISGNTFSATRNLTVNVSGVNPITLDAASSHTGATTYSITVTTNSNRILIVHVWSSTIGGPSGVTYNGAALTKLGSSNDSTSNHTISTWQLIAPASGTHNVVITGSGSIYSVSSSWYNVDQTTGTGAWAAANQSATFTPASVSLSPTLTTEVTTDAAFSNSGGGTYSCGSGQTDMLGTCGSFGVHASYKTAANGSTAMSETESSTDVIMAAVVLLPAAAPGDSVTGAVASISNNCNITSGSCTDTSNVLNLNQQYSSASGAVIGVQNNGVGDMVDFLNGSGTILSGFNASGNLFFSNSTFKATVAAATLTANRTITFPDASGTVCLDTGNCSGGAGGVTLQAGTPGAADTGNFNVSGVGIANTALVAPKLRPVSDSTTALVIQNAAGTTSILTADTTNGRIGIGTSGAPSATLDVLSTTATGNGVNLVDNSLTTGNAVNVSTSSGANTAGNTVNIADTGTAASPTTQGGSELNINRSLTANISSTPAIAVDATSSATTGGSAPVSKTWSHTVGTGINRYLVVMVTIRCPLTCSGSGGGAASVTYDGKAMTRLLGKTNGSTAELWGLTNPDSGTHNIVASWGAGGYGILGAVSFTNIDQTNPVDSTFTGSGSNTVITGTVSTTSSEYVVDDAASFYPSVMAAGSGQTSIIAGTDGGSNEVGASSYIAASGSSTTVSETSGTNVSAWAYSALSLRRSAGTLQVSGATANIQSNCTVTTGNCNDVSNVLNVSQQFSSATGAAVQIQNAGTGADLQLGTGRIRPTIDSTQAFQFQSTSGVSLLALDTVNSQVGIGTNFPINTLSTSPLLYNTGTISQSSSTTVVGVGTTFANTMIGSQLVYPDGVTDTVTGFTDTTHITVTTARVHSASNYALYYTGLQLSKTGQLGVNVAAPTAQLQVLAEANTTLDALVADTGASTGNIFIGKSNGTAAFTIGNTGAITGTGTYTFNTAGTDITTSGSQDLTLAAASTGVINLNDSVKVGTVTAVTSNSAALCRDITTTLLTQCDSTNTTGKPFLQGGNKYGAAADLGTDDAFALNLRTNGTTRVSVDTSGNLQFAQASTLSVISAATGTTFTVQAGAATSGTNVGGNLMLQGGAGSTTGASGSVIVKANTNNSTTAFQVQTAGAVALLTVDSTNSQVIIGSSTNTVTISGSAGLVAAGTARHTKTISLTAEYPYSVLDATNDASCSSANNGTMTSGNYFSSPTSINYYQWTTTQATAQCYDIDVSVPVPADFSAWASTTPLTLQSNTTNTTSGTISASVFDTAGTQESSVNYASMTPGSANTWTTVTSPAFAGTYAAGGTMTVRIRVTAVTGVTVQLGQFKLSYLSTF